jgi:malate dehydrogenase (oxaloacetate-decarboxylating)
VQQYNSHNKIGGNQLNIYEESVQLHKKICGKLEIKNKLEIKTKHDLSLVYTPGVAEPCRRIAQDPSQVYDLTIKKNSLAIVSDGSAVLGLGNIGAKASIPVMEGKAVLFKEYADIDAFPICLETQDPEEIINIVKNIAPVFGGINLEDISAPRCFEIEQKLQDLDIPVFHDDQHGTAIVTLAALINATKLVDKSISELNIVINGAGAAGIAITEMLLGIGYKDTPLPPVKNIILCDSKGIISKEREDISSNHSKLRIASYTNNNNISGTLSDAIKNTDVFIGVSAGNVVSKEMIKSMNSKPIVFAMANPIPEIMPEEAKSAGAYIVGTGRSDFPNQINNVLAFPGIFRGALDACATSITPSMKISAAIALAETVKTPNPQEIIPSPLDKSVCPYIALKVKETYLKEINKD